MIEVAKWLLLPLLGLAAWGLGALRPRLGCVLNLWAATVLFAIWAMEAATGMVGGPESLHRWLGQLLVGATWPATALGAGIFLQGEASGQQRRGAAGAIAALVSLVSVLIAAATGHMGPSHTPSGAGSSLGFAILHFVAAPGFAGLAIFVWFFISRQEMKEGGNAP